MKLWLIFFSLFGFSETPQNKLQSYLEKFYEDSYKQMNAPLEKSKKITKRWSVKEKIKYREEIFFKNKAQIGSDDQPSDLLRGQIVTNIDELDKFTHSTEMEKRPWSGDYWGIRSGLLGKRFADRSFPKNRSWPRTFKYARKYPPRYYVKNNITHLLSPAEKYDMLLGDNQFGLTNYMWNTGRSIYKEKGYVEKWAGICHGLAPASIFYDEPKYSVNVPTLSGRGYVKFYPDDIKALASYLWSGDNYEIKFIGGRCNIEKPKQDWNGRVINQQCFDSNPGTWHIVALNKLGGEGKAFLMDATYDEEVWNHPVINYEYTYFNPQTGEENDLDETLIKIEDFRRDKFKKFRSKDAKYVVGVKMTIEYVGDIVASIGESKENIVEVDYVYDLELDEDRNVIGGEWYTNKHPDFMWIPIKNANVDNWADRSVNNDWGNTSTRIPYEWGESGKEASRSGLVMAKIVRKLLKASQRQSTPREETSKFVMLCENQKKYKGMYQTFRVLFKNVGGRNCTDLYNRISKVGSLTLRARMRRHKLTNLWPLSYLPNLHSLSVRGHYLSDLRPLSKMTNLVNLDLSYNKIRSLEALSSLKGLKVLYLSHNKITDVMPLGGLYDLRELYLHDNRIRNLTPLGNLRNLRKFTAHDNPISRRSVSCPRRTNSSMINRFCSR